MNFVAKNVLLPIGAGVVLAWLLIAITERGFAWGSRSPETVVVKVIPQLSLDPVLDAVKSSPCATRKWKDRSVAPAGYMKGMALSFARTVCRPDLKDLTAAKAPPIGKNDALQLYGVKPKAGEEALRATYALLIGLGMRESSGKYCEGRDTSASNVGADEAEAGLFQFSHNSRVASKDLVVLIAEQRDEVARCDLDVFREGVQLTNPKAPHYCSPEDLKNFGKGAGAEFQAMAKDCPAFAARYGAIAIRVLLNHFGPLKRQEAEYRQECVDMLAAVEKQIRSQPELCELLN